MTKVHLIKKGILTTPCRLDFLVRGKYVLVLNFNDPVISNTCISQF